MDWFLLVVLLIIAVVIVGILISSYGKKVIGAADLPGVLNSLRSDSEPDRTDYINSKYHHSFCGTDIYVNSSGTLEYQVYPLCCTVCKNTADAELQRYRAAYKQNLPISPVTDVFITKHHPRNNMAPTEYPYMVMVRQYNPNYLDTAQTISKEKFQQYSAAVKTLDKIDDTIQNVRLIGDLSKGATPLIHYTNAYPEQKTKKSIIDHIDTSILQG